MKSLIEIAFLTLVLTSGTLYGQAIPAISSSFNPFLDTSISIQAKKPAFMMTSKPPSLNSPLFLKHELPKGAIFCRMEEQLWHKFNVWIKIRAGSDEMYRKLIETR